MLCLLLFLLCSCLVELLLFVAFANDDGFRIGNLAAYDEQVQKQDWKVRRQDKVSVTFVLCHDNKEPFSVKGIPKLSFPLSRRITDLEPCGSEIRWRRQRGGTAMMRVRVTFCLLFLRSAGGKDDHFQSSQLQR